MSDKPAAASRKKKNKKGFSIRLFGSNKKKDVSKKEVLEVKEPEENHDASDQSDENNDVSGTVPITPDSPGQSHRRIALGKERSAPDDEWEAFKLNRSASQHSPQTEPQHAQISNTGSSQSISPLSFNEKSQKPIYDKLVPITSEKVSKKAESSQSDKQKQLTIESSSNALGQTSSTREEIKSSNTSKLKKRTFGSNSNSLGKASFTRSALSRPFGRKCLPAFANVS